MIFVNPRNNLSKTAALAGGRPPAAANFSPPGFQRDSLSLVIIFFIMIIFYDDFFDDHFNGEFSMIFYDDSFFIFQFLRAKASPSENRGVKN